MPATQPGIQDRLPIAYRQAPDKIRQVHIKGGDGRLALFVGDHPKRLGEQLQSLHQSIPHISLPQVEHIGSMASSTP